MSNLDTIILNASGQTVREDIQTNLQAIKGSNSNSTLPAADSNTLINYMTIAETGSVNQLKVHIGTSNTFVPIIDISQGTSSGTHIAKPGTTAIPGYRFLDSSGSATQSGMGLPADTRLGFFVAGSEKLSVLSDGKVGIGTTSPSVDLEVQGDADINTSTADAFLSIRATASDSSNNAYLDFVADTTYTDYGLRIIRHSGGANAVSGIFHRGTGSLRFDTDEEGEIEFQTNSTKRWTMFGGTANFVSGSDSSRDLLTTSGAAFNFTGNDLEGLALVKSVYGWGTPLFIQLLNASGSRNLAEFQYNTGGSGTGTAVGGISTNGSSTSFNTSSDYRLKENVVAISDGITRLKTLKPYRFNFISDKDTTVDGFFAHEVTAVPEAVTGAKDETDSDNNPKYQEIDQSKIVPLLVAALQEAIAKIETLETKVAALEGS